MDGKDSVIVVGTRPTLPHHQVEVEDQEVSLRCRSGRDSTPVTPGQLASMNNSHGGPTASTPAESHVLGGERRSSPSFGTPGSLSNLCPDQLYLPPLDVMDRTPSTTHKSKGNLTFEMDSGYGAGVSFGTASKSKRSSLFDPFPNPEGSYVSNSSIWEMFSPVTDLKKKWKGRPSYLEDTRKMNMDAFNMNPRFMLGILMLMVSSASVGFAVLITFKHLFGNSNEMNNKYQSIEFGNQKIVNKLRKEGRMMEEVRDEEGNLLGGKRAAIQFSYDLLKKFEGLKDVEVNQIETLEKIEVKDKVVALAALASNEEADFEDLVEKDESGHAKRILDAAGNITTKIEVKSLEDQIKELEAQKQQKLDLIKRVKMFASKGLAPEPKGFKMRDETEVVVTVEMIKEAEVFKEKPKKSKSLKNPLLKDMPKPVKVTKVIVPSKSSIVIRPLEANIIAMVP